MNKGYEGCTIDRYWGEHQTKARTWDGRTIGVWRPKGMQVKGTRCMKESTNNWSFRLELVYIGDLVDDKAIYPALRGKYDLYHTFEKKSIVNIVPSSLMKLILTPASRSIMIFIHVCEMEMIIQNIELTINVHKLNSYRL
ncbi:hypothetical protein BDR06DRAFT_970287 [Suillus hirtellus]|nr:hypothetical protein BDR06DRAFT_970287 [Suillus hirtellus]